MGLVALLGHPCAIYAGKNVVRVQAAVQVRLKGDACPTSFESPWNEYSALFPLPDFRDGVDYVADFRRIGTVHAERMENRRVACLTHEGWAAFQRRYAYHSMRANIDIPRLVDASRKIWHEFEVWEEWNRRGFEFFQYQTWLQEPMEAGSYAGTRRDEVLEQGHDEVLAELPEPGSP